MAALLQHSARAFEAVRLAGAAHLIALGLWTLWYRGPGLPSGCASAGAVRRAPQPPGGRPAWRPFAADRAGIDLLNPKTGLFYVAVLPQVIPPGMPVLRSTLLFAGIDAAVAGARGGVGLPRRGAAGLAAAARGEPMAATDHRRRMAGPAPPRPVTAQGGPGPGRDPRTRQRNP